MIRNFSLVKRRWLILLTCVALLTGGLLMWNLMAEKGKDTDGGTLVTERETPPRASESSAPALPEKLPLAPHPDIPEKLLACGRWTIDDIRAHPAEIVAELRRLYSGNELFQNLNTIGNYIRSHGSMDDLHHFMCATDNPSATGNMARTMVMMAKDKADSLKLLEYTGSWKGQAEEELINNLLLRRAGQLVGMGALKLLEAQRDGEPSPAEITSLLSGTAENDPTGVREWLLAEDRSTLSVNQKANILSGIARVASMEDLLRDAAAISNGDAAAHDVYIRSAITVAGVGGNNPEATIAIILAADSLNEDQKGFGTQMLSTFWSSKDLVGASEWVAGLPEGSVRDRAVVGVLNTVHNGRLNMPEAEQWANSISDEKLRESALKNFIRRE